jgi:hypothetical protein
MADVGDVLYDQDAVYIDMGNVARREVAEDQDDDQGAWLLWGAVGAASGNCNSQLMRKLHCELAS